MKAVMDFASKVENCQGPLDQQNPDGYDPFYDPEVMEELLGTMKELVGEERIKQLTIQHLAETATRLAYIFKRFASHPDDDIEEDEEREDLEKSECLPIMINDANQLMMQVVELPNLERSEDHSENRSTTKPDLVDPVDKEVSEDPDTVYHQLLTTLDYNNMH